MLDLDDKTKCKSLVELFCPPEGMSFVRGCGCTYSVNQKTLGLVEKNLGVHRSHKPLLNLRTGESFRLHVQQGEFQGDVRGYLNMFRGVNPKTGVLHAKVYALNYSDKSGKEMWRVIVTSANLTNSEDVKVLKDELVKRLSDRILSPLSVETLAKNPVPVKDALGELLVKLFCEKYAVRAVRGVYPDTPYIDAVERYCQDGCLVETLREYLALLAAEYDGNAYRIAAAIQRVGRLKRSRPKLLLLDGGGKIAAKAREPDNPFAVGLFSEEQNADVTSRMNNLRGAFNSPFWPFVFISTSIGTEGIDLHWYARNVIHWSIPSRALDLEQREGRVLRYQCHAVRLNQALIQQRKISNPEDRCLEPLWKDSGMYDRQLDFFSDQEEQADHPGCYHVISTAYAEMGSVEELAYQEQMRIVGCYRLLLGCANMDEMNERLKGQSGQKPICLAPFFTKTKTGRDCL